MPRRVAAVLCQMGGGLQKNQEMRRGCLLQGVFYLSELRSPHPVYVYHELDRAAVEGLPEGYEDARGRD